jgi:hypothetical protein
MDIINRNNVEKQGNAAEILGWYQNLTKDEEYADSIDKAIERFQELKLH